MIIYDAIRYKVIYNLFHNLLQYFLKAEKFNYKYFLSGMLIIFSDYLTFLFNIKIAL